MDQVSQIMAFESGELDEDQTIELFQSLINSGLAWQLQGSYGICINSKWLLCSIIGSI